MGAPVSKTGVPYGFHAPADIRLVLANGKAMNPSSGGLAKRLRDKNLGIKQSGREAQGRDLQRRFKR
jgi:hypothetical protein